MRFELSGVNFTCSNIQFSNAYKRPQWTTLEGFISAVHDGDPWLTWKNLFIFSIGQHNHLSEGIHVQIMIMKMMRMIVAMLNTDDYQQQKFLTLHPLCNKIQSGISALIPQTSFCRETSDGV